MRSRIVMRAAVTAVLALSAVGLSLGSANAAEKDGWITSGEFGLFCLQNQGNSVFDLVLDDTNFANDYFKGSQSCAGHTTNDYTESYRNLDSFTWDVYTDWNRGGSHGTIPAGYAGNASATFKNAISSSYWVR
ncbi:hypothetical protein OTB20_37080 [Streptomyces sp. H27-H1]|uniref:hypothetical protein n=1 Tax=Streptomyces sp. H27-H1 TaxID=2996461 RepID=UPI00227098FE|nr:hypothetical protein [Streptomyces sp. H27-H1]MCY0931701.1 hypothetical protein [Streptomyces sp. H27-H1]